MTASCFPHPAALLETLLEEYEMDLNTCAARSGLDLSTLQDLLAARRDVDEEIASQLGRCFSGTQAVWLNHQAFHDSGLPSKISEISDVSTPTSIHSRSTSSTSPETVLPLR